MSESIQSPRTNSFRPFSDEHELKLEKEPTLKRATSDNATTCRICLVEDTEENLLHPCRCDGSSRWVHRACLDEWRKACPKAFFHCDVCKFRFRFEKRVSALDSQWSYHWLVLLDMLPYVAALAGLFMGWMLYLSAPQHWAALRVKDHLVFPYHYEDAAHLHVRSQAQAEALREVGAVPSAGDGEGEGLDRWRAEDAAEPGAAGPEVELGAGGAESDGETATRARTRRARARGVVERVDTRGRPRRGGGLHLGSVLHAGGLHLGLGWGALSWGVGGLTGLSGLGVGFAGRPEPVHRHVASSGRSHTGWVAQPQPQVQPQHQSQSHLSRRRQQHPHAHARTHTRARPAAPASSPRYGRDGWALGPRGAGPRTSATTALRMRSSAKAPAPTPTPGSGWVAAGGRGRVRGRQGAGAARSRGQGRVRGRSDSREARMTASEAAAAVVPRDTAPGPAPPPPPPSAFSVVCPATGLRVRLWWVALQLTIISLGTVYFFTHLARTALSWLSRRGLRWARRVHRLLPETHLALYVMPIGWTSAGLMLLGMNGMFMVMSVIFGALRRSLVERRQQETGEGDVDVFVVKDIRNEY